MVQVLRGKQGAAATAAILLGLTLAGCSGGGDAVYGGSNPTASPNLSATNGKSGDVSSHPAVSPKPSASGDWWPEHLETMATGQGFPDDYEPATLDHPARNVPKPALPEAAKQETEEGAQAFLNYYAYVGWYAYQTGDTSYMRAIVAPECEACFEEMDLINEIYSNGDWCAGSDERGEILPKSFIKNELGYYSIPIKSSNNGFKLVSKRKVVQEFMPYEDDGAFNVNIDFREGRWTYITASPRNLS